MSDLGPERLYGLLPEFLRYADAEAGQGLRAFLAVFDQEYAAIERSIAALYNDWFVETCDEWLLPYIGDLVGIESSTLARARTSRAFVGRSLHYRRRKGTPDALAGAASDATGWPAIAIPSFPLLAATQSMLDPHPHRGGTVDLRCLDLGTGGASRFGGPFDTIQRNVQVSGSAGGVRPLPAPAPAPPAAPLSISVSSADERYGLDRIGLFFWRLASYPMTRAAARPRGGGTYTFHPFGIDAPLFNPPRRRDGRPTPAHLPLPLEASTLNAEAAALSRRNGAEFGFLSPEPAVEIHVRYAGTRGAAQRIPPQAVLYSDLSSWAPPPNVTPLPGGGERAIQVAVDPALGRIAFPKGIEVEKVQVSYAYGFSADLGGGPYARPPSAERRAVEWRAEVGAPLRPTPDAPIATGVPPTDSISGGHWASFATLAEALSAWNDDAATASGRIVIASDEIYDLGSEPFSLALATPQGLGRRLEIVAANGRRPCLVGDLKAVGPASLGQGQAPSAALGIDGLWVDGTIEASGEIASLLFEHATIRPTRRTALSFTGQSPSSLEVTIQSSLVGSLRLPSEGCRLDIEDSVVDAAGPGSAIAGPLGIAPIVDPPGPTARLVRSTIFGRVHLIELAVASEMLFVDPVLVERRTRGLVRRSYLPGGSSTPHRESSLPEPGGDTSPPSFTSRIYGQPGYAQLAPTCSSSIALGPYGELGVFHQLRQPSRLALLPDIAAEFLPWGLEADIVFAT